MRRVEGIVDVVVEVEARNDREQEGLLPVEALRAVGESTNTGKRAVRD